MDGTRATAESGRLLRTLERLMEIEATEVKGALDEASDLVAEALRAEKIDAFLHDPAADTLVAVGTSNTPLGRLQREIGMHLLPVANGGRTVEVFETGGCYFTGRADEDPSVLAGISQGLGVRSYVVVPLHVGGERRGVLAAASTRPDAFSREDAGFLEAVGRWVGIVVHRAELVERIARDAAAQARRLAAEDLITVLAHDLNNYFTPLKARIDMLYARARREDRGTDVQNAQEARAALGRLRGLVSDLLDAGRLEQGIFALSVAPVDLAALVRQTVEVMSTGDAEVQARVPEEMPVVADPDRIRQALDNLVVNAVRHSPDGVPVLVEAWLEHGEDAAWAVLEIRDQGPGIPEEVMGRLFDRFSHGPGSTGLGLGLYLAQSIAHAHGGSLTMESRPSAGTTFQLRIPAAGAA